MSARASKKYHHFKQALKSFNPERITALYNDLGRHECKINKYNAKDRGGKGSTEWPLEFCIRNNYIKSAQHLISLDLPQEQLNGGLIQALKQRPASCCTELIKALLKIGAYVKSSAWIKDFTRHYQYNPEHRLEVLRILCTIPTDPNSRYYTLGMFLHYCCIGSRNCQSFTLSPLCMMRDNVCETKSLFDMTWYKSVEYLISVGLVIQSYWNQTIVNANLKCLTELYGYETNTTLIPHIDISVMSIMIRLAAGSMFSKHMFHEYVMQYISLAHAPRRSPCSHRKIVSHDKDFVKLLPLFYHTGVDVCDSPLAYIHEHRLEDYLTYRESIMGQPRTLQDLARLQVRITLTGPNILVSSRDLSGVPSYIREMITLRNLDVIHCLEPECVT